jgi:hypothetical protein
MAIQFLEGILLVKTSGKWITKSASRSAVGDPRSLLELIIGAPEPLSVVSVADIRKVHGPSRTSAVRKSRPE